MASGNRPARAALLALLLAAAAPARCEAAPAIAFDHPVCELGTVTQGEQPRCTFAFTNAGDEELRVLRVEPTCGCTTALTAAPLLAPGQRGEVAVTFDSSNFAGDVVKELTVLSSDPAHPAVTLSVRALVEPEVDFEPRTVTFEGVLAGAEEAQTVVLMNRRAEAVSVLRVGAEPATFGCALPGWSDPAHPLVVESWDRVALVVTMRAPAAVTMPIAGLCTLEIAGARKRLFPLKILALPAPTR
jgi:hypothetical protein